MDGDGNGWVTCSRGHTHWGRHGAAGLLLHTVDDAGVVRALLQHRAHWSHHGNTWGLPGGARDSHEDPVAAALREGVEEAGLDVSLIRTRATFRDDHGRWSYTTVLADTPSPLATTPNRESVALEWVAVAEVPSLPLHPGFAATWPLVRAQPTVLLVDMANVVGSRADGWWRDRAGASTRLLARLDALRGVTVGGSAAALRVIGSVVAVLEGAARAAENPGWVRVERTPPGHETSGDDVLAASAAALFAEGRSVLAVTADRGLRARVEALGGASDPLTPQCVGPGWLLDLMDESPRTGPLSGAD